MKFSIKLSTFLLLTAAPVIAEELIVLDEITVTAGYTDTGISETGASVSVLGEQDLKYSSSGLIQAFESVPGVSMDTNGGLGTLATISVRGLKQRYVGVRLDGMDITDPSQTQTSYDFGALTSMGLSQVEFLKGSQSAVFGSEAVGGVINLKTLSSNDKGARGKFTIEAGSFNTYSSNLSYENVSDSGSASFSVSRAETSGFSAKKTGLGANEADPYSGNSLNLSLDHSLTNNIGLNFVALSSSEVLEYDGFDALNDKQDRDVLSMKFGVEFEVGSITNEFEVTDGNFDRKYYGSGGSLYQSDRRDMLYKGQAFFNPVSVTFGASSSKENIKTSSQWENDSGSDTELAYFVETSSRVFDEIEVVATARQTDSDDFGSNTSYRAALIYNFNNGVTLRAMGSSGFRAPSLYERYSASYGNKSLKPEESKTQEVGAEKVYQDGSSARFTIFNTKVDNLIGSDPNTFAYIQSGDPLKSQGVELSGLWKMNDTVSLNGNYTYTDAKQGTTVAVRVPKHDLSISIAAEISPEITTSLTANHIRDYKDTGGDMPDYTVVNAVSSYTITDGLEGYIRFQNLLDSDYETIKDFNTGGRQIFAGIRATF